MLEVPVLFLDIDGTVRHGPDELGGRFVNSADDVVVFPAAAAMMGEWRAHHGGRIVGASNQGGVGLGHLTHTAALEAMDRTQQLTGGLFDLILMCIHAPGAGCACRKPGIGMWLQAVEDLARANPGEAYPFNICLTVGDRDEDRAAAQAAGTAFMWAAAWRALAEVQT